MKPRRTSESLHGPDRRLMLAATSRFAAIALCPLLLSGCFVLWPFGPPPARTAIPTTPPGPSAPPDLEGIPDLPISAMPGAPAVAVWSPEPNAQIRIWTWRSGSMTDELVVPLLNPDPVYLDHVRVLFSPTGKHFAVVEAADGPTVLHAFVRIFSSTGELAWTGPRQIAAHPTIRWSPDGNRFAVDASFQWLLVTPAASGERTVVIDTRRPVDANGGVEYPWELLDFSEDGATLFGSRSAGLQANVFPLSRAPAHGGPIESIASLPTKPGSRLAPLRQLLDNPLERPIDPATGRIVILAGSSGSAGTEFTLRSGKGDRRFILAAAADAAVTTAWLNGSLVVTYRGREKGQQQLGVVSTGADLGKERVVASFPVGGAMRFAGLVAVTDDYVLLSFGRGLPEVRNRLLLVRLSDSAQTAIDADGLPATVETFGFAGWITP